MARGANKNIKTVRLLQRELKLTALRIFGGGDIVGVWSADVPGRFGQI